MPSQFVIAFKLMQLIQGWPHGDSWKHLLHVCLFIFVIYLWNDPQNLKCCYKFKNWGFKFEKETHNSNNWCLLLSVLIIFFPSKLVKCCVYYLPHPLYVHACNSILESGIYLVPKWMKAAERKCPEWIFLAPLQSCIIREVMCMCTGPRR